jgi:hypothetical protein
MMPIKLYFTPKNETINDSLQSQIQHTRLQPQLGDLAPKIPSKNTNFSRDTNEAFLFITNN